MSAIFYPIDLNQPFFELIHADSLRSDIAISRNKFIHAQFIPFSMKLVLQFLSHRLCHPHISRLVVEVQKLGKVFFVACIFLLETILLPLFLVGRLKILHLSYELFPHHASSEAFLLTTTRERSVDMMKLGTLLMVVKMGAIDDA